MINEIIRQGLLTYYQILTIDSRNEKSGENSTTMHVIIDFIDCLGMLANDVARNQPLIIC